MPSVCRSAADRSRVRLAAASCLAMVAHDGHRRARGGLVYSTAMPRPSPPRPRLARQQIEGDTYYDVQLKLRSNQRRIAYLRRLEARQLNTAGLICLPLIRPPLAQSRNCARHDHPDTRQRRSSAPVRDQRDLHPDLSLVAGCETAFVSLRTTEAICVETRQKKQFFAAL